MGRMLSLPSGILSWRFSRWVLSAPISTSVFSVPNSPWLLTAPRINPKHLSMALHELSYRPHLLPSLPLAHTPVLIASCLPPKLIHHQDLCTGCSLCLELSSSDLYMAASFLHLEPQQHCYSSERFPWPSEPSCELMSASPQSSPSPEHFLLVCFVVCVCLHFPSLWPSAIIRARPSVWFPTVGLNA